MSIGDVAIPCGAPSQSNSHLHNGGAGLRGVKTQNFGKDENDKQEFGGDVNERRECRKVSTLGTASITTEGNTVSMLADGGIEQPRGAQFERERVSGGPFDYLQKDVKQPGKGPKNLRAES